MKHEGVKILHATEQCVYLLTTAEPRSRLHMRKTGLSPPTPVIYTDRSKAVLLLWFILIVYVRPLSVGLCLLLFYLG